VCSSDLRGLVEVTLGKAGHALPHFSGETPIAIGGATLLPQSLWVMAVTAVVVAALAVFFGRTRVGKGILATAHNRLAAQLVGVDVKRVLLASFGLAAALGAVGGVLITPIATTSYDAGLMLGLKGFVAATFGGLGSGVGAVAGGVLLGLIETMTAGYVSSSYKDAVPFVLVLVVLVVRPRGLFGLGSSDRV
jgi:branched-chain amino acid transport system permease protein